MATLTKKDLLEAIEDMPENAKFVMVTSKGEIIEIKPNNIICDTKKNMIGIC